MAQLATKTARANCAPVCGSAHLYATAVGASPLEGITIGALQAATICATLHTTRADRVPSALHA